MKKFIITLMLIALLAASCFVVNGYTNISNGTECFLCSLGYSGGTIKVLNVYTSGTPISGNLVTIYTYSGSNTQKWKIVLNDDLPGVPPSEVPTDSYRILTMGDSTETLALNYNQSSNGGCTVYPYDTNDTNDFPVGFNTASGGGYTIWLVNRPSRYLGNSGSTNGSQCYWYIIGNNGISSEDIWLML